MRSSDQWFIMGSAELRPQTVPELDAYSRGLAAAQPGNPSATSHQPATGPSWWRNLVGFSSGLALDSMSNMLSRNNETGHQPFHLTPFTDCQSCQLVSYLDDVYFNSHLWIFLWYAVGKRQVWPSPVPCGLRRSFM